MLVKVRRGRKKKVVTDQAAELASSIVDAAVTHTEFTTVSSITGEEEAAAQSLFAETRHEIKEEIDAVEAIIQQQLEQSVKEQPVAEGEQAAKRRRKLK